MKNQYFLPVIFISFLSVATSYAAENCKNPETQLAMNICSAKDYEREDLKLNENYKKLIGKIESKDKEKLKEIQISWIKFKDLQCEYTASKYDGGSMQPLIRSSCLLQMTKQRNKELKAMIEDSNQ